MKPKNSRPSEPRSSGKLEYSKPVLVKHGLLDAEAAAFSTLY